MTIPFIDLFKKLTDRFFPAKSSATPGNDASAAPARPAPPRVKKTGQPSLSKTVLPNRTRSFAAPDPFRAAAGMSEKANPSMQLTPGKVVSGVTPPVPRSRQLPRALALALEPKLERAVSLRIADFIDQVPTGFIKPVEILDTEAPVSLKASEIEKGMAEGKPSVSLLSLYQQVPEIFLRSVPVDDETRVELPYNKVYAQFKSARVREDQETDPDIPQVDTPILQVTLEETKKFGTKMEPLQSSSLPPVPVEPATAQTLAKAEPEAAVLFDPSRSAPARSPHPVISLQSLKVPAKDEHPVLKIPEDATKPEFSPEPPMPTVARKDFKPAIEIPSKFPVKPPEPEAKPSSESVELPKTEPKLPVEKKIPFEFPPNGTGAPASERVPASSGPPVPIPLSTSPAPIPFKSFTEPVEKAAPVTTSDKAPDEESATKAEPPKKAEPPQLQKTKVVDPQKSELAQTELQLPSTAELMAQILSAARPEPAKQPASVADVSKLRLDLLPVLKTLPPFQVNGDIESVPEFVKIEFPVSLIEPQLAKGRVAVSPEQFKAAIPEPFGNLFEPDEAHTPVLLPLQDVLKNLPEGVLKLRIDQETPAPDKEIETPFSMRAREDAEHFAATTPQPPIIARLAEAKKAVEPAKEIETEAKESPAHETDELEPKLDVKEVITKTGSLPGVRACAITFSDGLNLAGTLPPQMKADGLSAMAPSLFQKVAKHVKDTNLGGLVSLTVQSQAHGVTFFGKGNICLSVLHADEALPAQTREEVASLVTKLSRTYAQPEMSHVDH